MLRKGVACRTGSRGLSEAQGWRGALGLLSLCELVCHLLLSVEFSFCPLSSVFPFLSTNLYNEERSLVPFQKANWSKGVFFFFFNNAI